jgi:MFS family permease
MIMFVICFIYPLLLWQAKTLWFFVFVMGVWGVYFDLYGFGVFDYVGRHTKKSEHSQNFGIVQIFRALGGIIAPLVVGLVLINGVDWRTFSLSWVFLTLGFILFVVLIIFMRKHRAVKQTSAYPTRRKNLFVELHLWKKLGRLMTPVLLMTFYLFFIEAFFWTLAPLYAENLDLKQFGGLFLTAYTLPALIVGWFVGPLTEYFGKKRIAFSGLLIGSLILSSFYYITSPILSILVVFLASCFISMALPAINAAYADYISEAPQVEGEIESLEDFAFNIGYVIGPIFAGILADIISMRGAFSILGIMGAVLAFILIAITPKSIDITTKASEL